ncbi:MAG: DoxX family protein [Actinomycetia bacterium]|nr:DoxX family protein [Actinomycetes bacterium]
MSRDVHTTNKSRANTIVWVIQILVAVFFVTAASLPKFFGQETATEMFGEIGYGDWFRYFVATCELAGAIGLVIPRLAALAASCLIALLAGAVGFLVFVLDDPQLVVTPIVLGALLVVIARKRLPEAAVPGGIRTA